MRVLSSHAERCIMSVQCLLAGLMPPDEAENLLPIPWQPVAVNVIPSEVDYVRDINLHWLTHWLEPAHFIQMLYQLDAPCPKYDAMYNKFLTDPDPQTDFYRYTQQLAGLYGYLSEHMGEVSALHTVATRFLLWFSKIPNNFPFIFILRNKNVTQIRQITRVEDTLFVQANNNLKLPAWTNSIYPDLLHDVKARRFQLYTETLYMTRIRGGPFLTDVFQQMQQKQRRKLSRKIAIYSAHDDTISNVMRALNVIDQTTVTPEYGATLALELHCDDDMECTVKVSKSHLLSASKLSPNWFNFFRNDKQIFYNFDTYEKEPKQLMIPECPHPCRLNYFHNFISDYLIYNITQDCELWSLKIHWLWECYLHFYVTHEYSSLGMWLDYLK